MAHGHGVQGAAQGQLRASVEAEPAQPQDEHSQGNQQHVGRRSGPDGAVAAELAQPGPDDEHAGQGRPAAGAVDDGGAGKVAETLGIQPAAAPGPGADYGVDDGGEHQGKQEEQPHFYPLGDGAGDYGGGGGHEDHLEEPVGHGGIAALYDVGHLVGLAAHQGDLGRGGAVQAVDFPDEVAQQLAVHELVAQEEVGQAGDGVDADVLKAYHGGVLGADRSGLQHGEAGAHPHDEGAPDQEGEGVEDELGLLVDAGGLGDGRAGEDGGDGDDTRYHRNGNALVVGE